MMKKRQANEKGKTVIFLIYSVCPEFLFLKSSFETNFWLIADVIIIRQENVFPSSDSLFTSIAVAIAPTLPPLFLPLSFDEIVSNDCPGPLYSMGT